MKEPILVVMAAGIGSRYGGLKQTDPIGKNGELIIDYSVFDAIKAGFHKVVFIINHTIEREFKEIIGNRLEAFIEVAYAYQELKDVPGDVELPVERLKPLGTAHAVYSARHLIDAPFAVINADDYYGKEAFTKIYDYLSQSSLGDYDYAMVGYQLKNTVTESGYVSRGICSIDANSYLSKVTERVHIEKRADGIAFMDENQWYPLKDETIVSMNMWGFGLSMIEEITARISEFFKEALLKNPLKCEYFLPFVVDEMIQNGQCRVFALTTKEKWYGVTYSEDKLAVVKAITKMINQNKYPEQLWEV